MSFVPNMNRICRCLLLLATGFLLGCQQSTNPETDRSHMPEAAQKLHSLYDRLRGQGHIIPDKMGCDRTDLEIFEKHYDQPLPDELVDFLCATLPGGYLDIGVYKTADPKALLYEQLGAVPLEGNVKHGFFGLGWWTGDTDGDGWLYDLQGGKIYAVQIYNNDEDNRAAVIEAAYQEFDSFDTWVDFLEQECRDRGWIQ